MKVSDSVEPNILKKRVHLKKVITSLKICKPKDKNGPVLRKLHSNLTKILKPNDQIAIKDNPQTFGKKISVEEKPKQRELQKVEVSQPTNCMEITHQLNADNTLASEDVPLTKVMMCAFCNAVFPPSNISAAQSHILGHFRNIANAIYSLTYWDMRRFLKNEDPTNKNSECYVMRSIYQCEFCPMVFLRKSNTIIHAIRHHQYSKMQNQREHSYGYPGAEMTYVVCNVCYMHFTTLDILKTHRLMEKHYFLLPDENNECTLGCLFCKKYFPKYSDFIEHTTNEHAQKMNCIGSLEVLFPYNLPLDKSQTDISLADATTGKESNCQWKSLIKDLKVMQIDSTLLKNQSGDPIEVIDLAETNFNEISKKMNEQTTKEKEESSSADVNNERTHAYETEESIFDLLFKDLDISDNSSDT